MFKRVASYSVFQKEEMRNQVTERPQDSKDKILDNNLNGNLSRQNTDGNHLAIEDSLLLNDNPSKVDKKANGGS